MMSRTGCIRTGPDPVSGLESDRVALVPGCVERDPRYSLGAVEDPT